MTNESRPRSQADVVKATARAASELLEDIENISSKEEALDALETSVRAFTILGGEVLEEMFYSFDLKAVQLGASNLEIAVARIKGGGEYSQEEFEKMASSGRLTRSEEERLEEQFGLERYVGAI